MRRAVGKVSFFLFGGKSAHFQRHRAFPGVDERAHDHRRDQRQEGLGAGQQTALGFQAAAALGIGLAAGIMARLGFMKSFPKALITACVAGFVAVLISTPLNVIFWGGTTGNVWGDMVFAATQAAGLSTLLGSFLDEIVVDVPDKIITLIVVYFVLKGLPRKLTALYDANAKIEHLE